MYRNGDLNGGDNPLAHRGTTLLLSNCVIVWFFGMPVSPRQQSTEKSCLRTHTVSGGVRLSSSVGLLSFSGVNLPRSLGLATWPY